jgi:4-amino-4-deoxy-L-arabinose transferase-like glycosyltransferase
MAVIFDIIIVVFIVMITFKLFSNSLVNKIDANQRINLLWISFLGVIFKLGIVAVWFWQVQHATDDLWLDTYAYNQVGQYLAENFRQWVFYSQNLKGLIGEYGSPGYYYFVGFIYTLFGYQEWMVSVFNNLLGVWFSMLMYHIAFKFFGHRIAKFTFIFNLFFPSFVYWGYFILKELLVVLSVVMVVWSAIQICEQKASRGALIRLILSLLLLLYIRPQYAVVLGLISPIHIVISRSASVRFRKLLFGLFFLLLFITIVSLIRPRGMPGLSVLQAPIRFTPLYHTDVSNLFVGCSLREPGEILSRIRGYPLEFIRHTAEVIFRTFWLSTSLYARSGPHFHHVAIDISGILMIFLMPMVIWGGIYSIRYKTKEMFVFYIFITAITIALIFSGHPTRLGLAMMPFILMFAGKGWVNFAKYKSFYILYILMFNLLIAVNATMYHHFIVARYLFILTLLGILLGIMRYRKSFSL